MGGVISPFGNPALPTGSAGGDLTGTYPNPTVAGISAGTGPVTTTGNINGHDIAASGLLIGSAGNGLKLTNGSVPLTPSGAVDAYAAGGGMFYIDPTGASVALAPVNKAGAPMPAALGESASRTNVSSSFSPTSGSLYIAAVQLMAGQSIGHIGFCTGTTAAVTPTHWWTALLDNTYKQQAHAADQLTGALAASTWFSLAMATPFTTAYTGTYYLAVMFAAGTTPTVLSTAAAPDAQFITGAGVPTPLVGGVSSTGLTAPGIDGTTVYVAPTAAAQTAYLYCTT